MCLGLIAQKKTEERENFPNEVHNTNVNTNATSAKPIAPPMDINDFCEVNDPPETINEVGDSSKKDTKARRAKSQQEKMPKLSERFDGLNHLPGGDDKSGPRKGYRCKRNGCGKSTTFFCTKCKVHLCITTDRNCFIAFHNLSES